MKVLTQLLIIGSLFLFGCKNSSEQVDADGNSYFGEKIEKVKPVDLGTLLTQMESQDTVRTQLEATVEAVCQTKGCWMNLVDNNTAGDASIFVKFKDYGFFMPKDIAGKKVVVEGIAFKETTSVEELRHYAEDEGKTPEEIAMITEPEEELKFTANGVIIL